MDTITVGSGLLGAEENVTVPLHLLSEGRHFKFKITMHYPKEEKVESPEYSLPDPLDPISKFHAIIIMYGAVFPICYNLFQLTWNISAKEEK